MTHDDVTTEELHLAYRVVDMIAQLESGEQVSGHVMAAAAELLRIAYRARTMHDPITGQATLLD